MRCQSTEPPYAEAHVWWCEKTKVSPSSELTFSYSICCCGVLAFDDSFCYLLVECGGRMPFLQTDRHAVVACLTDALHQRNLS